jgi:cytochrome c2
MPHTHKQRPEAGVGGLVAPVSSHRLPPKVILTEPNKAFVAVIILLATSVAEAETAAAGSLGNVSAGQELIGRFGCGACHDIPGIVGAHGLLGPPLSRVGRRVYIAGVLRNTPGNMAAWVFDPQSVIPGNAMPTVGLSRKQARDVAAYLGSLQ